MTTFVTADVRTAELTPLMDAADVARCCANLAKTVSGRIPVSLKVDDKLFLLDDPITPATLDRARRLQDISYLLNAADSNLTYSAEGIANGSRSFNWLAPTFRLTLVPTLTLGTVKRILQVKTAPIDPARMEQMYQHRPQ